MGTAGGRSFWNPDRAADLVGASRLRGWLVLVLAALCLLLIGLEGRRLYRRLPDQIPAKYSLSHRHQAPDATYQKTPWSVFPVLGGAAFALLVGAIVTGKSTAGVSRRAREEMAQVLSLPNPQREYVIAPYREAVGWACAIVAACLALMQRAMWYAALGGSGAYPFVWLILGVIVGSLITTHGEKLMIRRAAEFRPPPPSDSQARTAGS